MANAKSTVKIVQVTGDVTLTLTPIEAVLLRSLIGEITSTRVNTVTSMAHRITDALCDAGVPETNEYIAEDRIRFTNNAMSKLEQAMREWTIVGEKEFE